MTSLDLLILFLVHRGTNTPYLLRSRARISLGASLPALDRLSHWGLIKESKPGPRGRREFALTLHGLSAMTFLDDELQVAVAEPRPDLESVMRLVACAIVKGRKNAAVRLLKSAAGKYQKRSATLNSTLPDAKSDAELPELYTALIARCEASRLRAYASTLRALASHYGKDRKVE